MIKLLICKFFQFPMPEVFCNGSWPVFRLVRGGQVTFVRTKVQLAFPNKARREAVASGHWTPDAKVGKCRLFCPMVAHFSDIPWPDLFGECRKSFKNRRN